MNRKIVIFSIIGLLIIVGAIFAGGQIRYYMGKAVTADRVLFIPTNASSAQLIDSLIAGEAVADPHKIVKYLNAKRDGQFRSGRYELKTGMTYRELVNILASGRQIPVRVTFNNQRTVENLSGALAKRIELDSLSILETLRSDTVTVAYGLTPQTIMAMFIPNTYEFYWNTSPKDLLDRMKREYDKFWSERDAKLERLGMSRQEVVTLASIVYEETKKEAEMPRVAGVYVNRLKVGMPLQADPTVKFAMNDFALRRILHKHLEVDSPYNTYEYAGLPPGPIAMPSIAAIDAVLGYENHDYMYFCAKDDLSGAHVFAVTLDEHNKNARAYARALNRLKIK